MSNNLKYLFKKVILYFYTIRYLKPKQIVYQIWYRIRPDILKTLRFRYQLAVFKEGEDLKMFKWIDKPVSYCNHIFTFINQDQEFLCEYNGNRAYTTINWNLNDYGKLWAYNLNYMDYLLQPPVDKEAGFCFIKQFINDIRSNTVGLEPYPIALRTINWIKFFSYFSVNGQIGEQGKTPVETEIINDINASLYAQYKILLANLEYHLLGNHLLEDGFSLLFGAFYFKDKILYKKASEILESELCEQILNDGGHFELSPMYHQIILDKLLDSVNLLKNNIQFEEQESLLKIMEGKAGKMLFWLKSMTFSNGDIPLFNDSAMNTSPSSSELFEYAARIGITTDDYQNQITLFDSGYRRFDAPKYECIIDIGDIGPLYQPGHAHADTFSFVLYVKNNQCIVDTGISTYETNSTRLYERGTSAHNSVTVGLNNSSEVWSSFRVGRRAKVKIIKDDKQNCIASHNGFNKLKTNHHREWFFSDNTIEIHDILSSNEVGKVHLILAPDVFEYDYNNVVILQNCIISFENAREIQIQKLKIPAGYNIYKESEKIEVSFKSYVKTIIRL